MVAMAKSEIEWIEEVPAEWKTARLGNSVYMKGRIGWQGLRFADFIDEGPYLVTGTDFEKGKIVWSRCYHISRSKYSEDPAIHLCSKDVLFTKDGTVGKVAYVDNLPGPATLNSHLLLLRPKTKELNSGYLFWVLQSSVFERYKNLVQHGSVMDSISQTDMSHFIVPLPPREEQEAIAKYLDAKIGLNDRLADVVEKQISDLERYRASVIHEAVTRGLNPNVPTKPSGIEWFTNIPEAWSTTRITAVAERHSGHTPNKETPEYWKDGDIVWISLADSPTLRKKKYVNTSKTMTTRQGIAHSSAEVLPKGSVLLSRDASVGLCAIAGCNLAVSQHFMAYVCGPQLNNNYLLYCFKDMQQVFHKLSMGSTIPTIGLPLIKRLEIPLPTRQEQNAIVEHLDARTAAIDAVLDTKRKQVDILKRRRQSLIYEYVTGKRRVTEEA